MSNAWVIVLLYLGLVVVMSVISFAVFGFDKRRARNGGRRVSERTLLLMAFLGGWPGAFQGQRYFRHKTSKPSFQIAFWIVVALHVSLAGAAAYRFLVLSPV